MSPRKTQPASTEALFGSSRMFGSLSKSAGIVFGHLGAGNPGPGAEVGTATKTEMRFFGSVDVERLWICENGGVTVGSSQHDA